MGKPLALPAERGCREVEGKRATFVSSTIPGFFAWASSAPVTMIAGA